MKRKALHLLIFFFLSLIASQRVVAQIPTYVPTSGLIAYYPFNGNMTDATGSGNNGVLYGTVAYGVDRFGNPGSCFSGSGAGEGDVPTNTFPTGNAARSISVFFKYTLPYAGGGRAFFGWGNNSFAGRFNLFGNNTYVGVEYVNGVVKANGYTPDSCWHNLTATYPATGGGSSAVKLYMDGSLVTTTIVLPTASYSTPNGPWHGIGGNIYYLPGYGDSWTGKLDDIGVWNRELTATEVAQIWNGGISGGSGSLTISGAGTICSGGSITLSGAPVGGVWSLSSGSVVTISAAGVVTGLSAGTAVVTYSTFSACVTSTDTALITVLPLPDAGTISGPVSVCPGASITLINATGGGTWTSSNPGVATVGVTGIVGGGSAGTTIISYSVSNACGTAVDTQAITVVSPPVVGTIAGPSHVCEGLNITLSVGGTGGTWSCNPISVATIGGTTGIVSGVTAGVAIVTYSVSNLCATAIDTYAITVDALPNAGNIVGATMFCAGSSITLTNAVSGGIWSSSSSGILVGGSSGTVTGLSAGTSVITYSVSNVCGTATDTQTVTVNPLPDAGTITGLSTIICANTVITLSNTASGGTWSSSNVSIATIGAGDGRVTGLAAGTTTITYSMPPTAFGCTSSVTYLLTVILPASFVANGSITNIKCYGGNNGVITVVPTGGVGPYQYTWDNGSNSSAISGLVEGTYSVIVKDLSSNCIDTESFSVTMPFPIVVTSVVQNDNCGLENGSIDINITGGVAPYGYLWSNGMTSEDISGLAPGMYTINVADVNLCTVQQFIEVGLDSCNELVIHDVMTPNGDGKNDVWIIEGLNKYPANSVQLYDKWGDVVFSAVGYKNDWAGERKNGMLLPDGTYFYIVKLNAENQTSGKNVFTGSFLIKR